MRLGPGDRPLFRAMNCLFGAVFEDHASYGAKLPDDAYADSLLARRDTVLLLAEASGDAIGALAGYILPKYEQARSELYIYDLAVIDAWRRRGVATALIDETRRIARDVGAWTVFVQADTIPEDEPARTLYRKLASEEITALHFDIAP
jgi:aminoglycoside 3-N-acetyltransferase I